MLPSLLPLNDSETHLLERSRVGEPAVLPPTAPPIRGEFIRRLQLRLPLDGAIRGTEESPATSGIWLVGATVAGAIDLSESHGSDHAGQPPLRFEDCRLVGELAAETKQPVEPALDISHARIVRLSLKRTRFNWVDMSDAEIGGDLDLRDIGPLATEDVCHVKARDTLVRGNVKADHACCRGPQTNLMSSSQRSVFALDFSGAHIEGGLFLIEPRIVGGGLRLRNATLGGDLVIMGGEFIGQRGFDTQSVAAIDLQSATVRGNIMIVPTDDGSVIQSAKVRGNITMFGCHVGGSVELAGVSLRALQPSLSPFLLAGTCRVGGTFRLVPYVRSEHRVPLSMGPGAGIFLNSCRIGADLNIEVDSSPDAESGGHVPGQSTTRYLNLDLGTCAANVLIKTFPGHVFGEGLSVQGRLDLILERTSLSLNSARVTGPALIKSHGESGRGERPECPSIDLSMAQFGNTLTFVPCVHTATLKGVKVQAALSLYQAASENEYEQRVGTVSPQPPRLWLDFEDAVVAGDIEVKGFLPPDDVYRLPVESWGDHWSRKLNCLPGWTLHEFRALSLGDEQVFAMLEGPAQPETDGESPTRRYLLDGQSAWIHFAIAEARSRGPTTEQTGSSGEDQQKPRAWSCDNVLEYLRLFTTYVFSDDAFFWIVESLVDANVVLNPLDRWRVARQFREPGIEQIEVSESSKTKKWRVTICLLYVAALYSAEFDVTEDGTVVMVSDDKLLDVNSLTPLGRAPFRRFYRRRGDDQRGWSLPLAFRADGWVRTEGSRNEPLLRGFPIHGQPVSPELRVSLRGVRAGGLDDADGLGWFVNKIVADGAPALLDLDGLTYGAQGASRRAQPIPGVAGLPAGRRSSLVESRLAWLRLQYGSPSGHPVPTQETYAPQPWEQLARVLRDQGNGDQARSILLERLRLERQIDWHDPTRRRHANTIFAILHGLLEVILIVPRWAVGVLSLMRGVVLRPLKLFAAPWRTPLNLGATWDTLCATGVRANDALLWAGRAALDIGFGHGLSTRNALLTCTAFVVVGWHAVEVANSGRLYWFSFGDAAMLPSLSITVTTEPVLVVDSAAVSPAAVTQTSPTGVAVATPLLRVTSEAVEEVPCGTQIEPLLYAIDLFVPLLDLRQESKCTISSRPTASGWRLAKALYAILGWLVVSMSVLTVTGVLRRNIER